MRYIIRILQLSLLILMANSIFGVVSVTINEPSSNGLYFNGTTIDFQILSNVSSYCTYDINGGGATNFTTAVNSTSHNASNVNTTLLPQGVNTVVFYCNEYLTPANNGTASINFSRDSHNPITVDNSSSFSGWNLNNFNVTITSTDNGSGVNFTSYRLNGTTWVNGTNVHINFTGNLSIEYFSQDSALNTESITTVYAALDKLAPTTTDDAPSGWQNLDTYVTLTPSDGHSGILLTNYSYNGSANITGTLVNTSINGNQSVTYYSIDNAGNIETSTTIYVAVDKEAPTTTDNSSQYSGWQSSDFTVVLTASDNYSGLSLTNYSLNFTANVTGTSIAISSTGNQSIIYYSVDNAGNIEADTEIYVALDKQAPTTTDDAPSGWQTTNTVVTLSPSDGHSGLRETNYSLAGAANVTGTSVNASAEGNKSIVYYSVDNVGNMETPTTVYVAVDQVAPTTILNTTANSGWRAADFNIGLNASDATSGLRETNYSLNGSTNATGTSIAVSSTGNQSITFYSVDNANNMETPTTVYVALDKQNPSTTDNAPTGWQNSDIIVTLTPTDSHSGVSLTNYSNNGSTNTTGTSINISSNGNSSFTYYSVDNVGNVEAVNTVVNILLDKTNPFTSDNNPSGWQMAAFNITLTPSDTFSGVAETNYSLNGTTNVTGTNIVINESGNQSLTYYSVDNAGNMQTAVTVYAALDLVNPTTTDNAPTGWQAANFTITLTPSDGHSGISYTNYSLNGSANVTGTTVSITTNGNQSITYYSVDNAGNIESSTTVYVALDNSTPTTTDNTPSGWQATNFTVTLTPADTYSGLSLTNYSLNGSSNVTGTNIVVNVSGNQSIAYYSIDVAGNVETTTTVYAALDQVNPTTTDNAPAGWQTSDFNVTLTPSDGHSGISHTTYRVNGGSWANGTNVVITNNGNVTLEYYSVDNVGNNETINLIYVALDKLTPITTDNASSYPGFQSSAFSIILTPTDNVSGVAYTSYRIDAGAWANGTQVNITTDGNHTISYYSVDVAGNNESVNTAFGALDMSGPTVNITSPANGSSQSGLSLNISVNITDALSSLDTCFYSLNSGSNTTFNCSATQVTISNLTDGSKTMQIFANDTLGNMNSDVVTFSIANFPSYSNINVVSPVQYAPNRTYFFNLTWTDESGISNALVQFNNSNSSMANTGNIYLFNTSNLLPGNYSYYFSANDTTNNRNTTPTFTLEVINLSEEVVLVENDSVTVSENITLLQVENVTVLEEVVVPENVDSNETVELNLSNVVEGGTNVTIVNNLTLTRETSSTVNLTVVIPENTTIVAASGWDGTFKIPTVNTTTFSIVDGTVNLAVTVGGGSVELNLTNPARVVLGGQANRRGAWSQSGITFTVMDTVCNSATNPTNINSTGPRECYITSGSDLIIWTYHFTTFGAFTQSSTPSGSGGGGGGGGSSYTTYKLGDLELNEPIGQTVSENRQLNFNINGVKYELVIDEIEKNRTIFDFESPDDKAKDEIINLGEVILFDTDNNGVGDTQMWYEEAASISKTKITFYLNYISEGNTETSSAQTSSESSDSSERSEVQDVAPPVVPEENIDFAEEEIVEVPQEVVEEEEVIDTSDIESNLMRNLGIGAAILVIIVGIVLFLR